MRKVLQFQVESKSIPMKVSDFEKLIKGTFPPTLVTFIHLSLNSNLSESMEKQWYDFSFQYYWPSYEKYKKIKNTLNLNSLVSYIGIYCL